MSAIRSKGNETTEIAPIRLFREYKVIGWQRNQAMLSKPDFIFPKQKIALFVDGCFWHEKVSDIIKEGKTK